MSAVYIFTILFIIGCVFVYDYSRPKKPKLQPFPNHWQPVLEEKVLFYRRLQSADKQRFESRLMKFLSEVNISGISTTVEELDKILIASSAVIPVFGFDDWEYAYLDEVLLYPTTFNQNFETHKDSAGRNTMGMVGSGLMHNKMILSRNALRNGFNNKTDKLNTGIHEFIHLLDKEDGKIDGIPKVLLQHQYTIPWIKMIHDKMEEINNDKSDIRHYGGTSTTEFLAVAGEYFFERPKLLKRKHPELFKMMVACFQPPK
jgi:hypothetical protein